MLKAKTWSATDLGDAFHDVINCLNSVDGNKLRDCGQQLQRLREGVDSFTSQGVAHEATASARYRLARAALEVSQQIIPRLQALANEATEVAGAEAVRAVCAPTQLPGTGYDGKPYPPKPSGFTVPPGFEEKPTQKIMAAAKGVVAAVLG